MKSLKSLLFSMLILSAFVLKAQTTPTTSTPTVPKRVIKANTKKERIESVDREGETITIELNNSSIKKEWETKLKSFGKFVKINEDSYKVTEANVPGIASNCIVYAKCSFNSNGMTVWWTFDTGSDGKYNKGASEHALEDFARQQYVNDINEQIKDAEEALKVSVRVQQKQIDKGENIQNNIVKNNTQKLKLEEQLRLNAEELTQLQMNAEQNVLDQKLAEDEVLRMQRALDLVKAKLNGL